MANMYLKEACVTLDNENNELVIQTTAMLSEYENVKESQNEHAPVIKPIELHEM